MHQLLLHTMTLGQAIVQQQKNQGRNDAALREDVVINAYSFYK